MAMILAAVVTVLGLIVVEVVRCHLDRKRDAAESAAERGVVYEGFITEALRVVQALQLLTRLSPRLAVRRLRGPALTSFNDVQAGKHALDRAHAGLRRIAPDDVAAAAEGVLKVVERAAELMRLRSSNPSQWNTIWADARGARISFEQVARADAGGERAKRGRG